MRNRDVDESSRNTLTNRGITYITENRRKITGIMTIQAYIECKQARMLLTSCKNHFNEILLLQKSIRAAMNRMESKEEVAKCDKENTIEPHAGKLFSPRGDDNELEDEKVFITQRMVNRCLDDDYSIHSSIIQYFVQDNESKFIKSLKKNTVEEIAKKIDRKNLFGFYQCEENEVFAIV